MLENILSACFCFVIVIKSAAYLISTGKILRKGILAEGRIVGIESRSFLWMTFKCPIIEFTTNTGRKIKGIFKPIWITNKFPATEKVMVIYNSRRPSQFFVDNRHIDLVNFILLSLSVSAFMLILYKLSIA